MAPVAREGTEETPTEQKSLVMVDRKAMKDASLTWYVPLEL